MKTSVTETVAECGLCPRHCQLAPGQRGVCHARWNEAGDVVPIAPCRVCSLSVDPIEKKPLHHVVPGEPILSVACAGCTLRCLHCQNAGISQVSPDRVDGRVLPPAELAQEMVRAGCNWVAYTYTEPMAWFEYTRDGCRAVLEAGGRNVLVTAAYAETAPIREIAPLVAAANVDIKAMSERFYREVCGGSLWPVLRAVKELHRAGVHVEITNLVIPGKNDNDAMLSALVGWVVAVLGDATPLHFSRFMPCHRMSEVASTPVATLRRARELAIGMGMKHVYIGNADVDGASDTACPQCGTVLVRRDGYRIREQRVTPEGRCPDCSAAVRGIWS